jgi:hypothetical protein
MLDHPLDLMADFRAIYRIDDPSEISAPDYFALAYRLPAYQGMVAARVSEQQEVERRETGGKRARKVESTRASIESDPELGSVISFG